jgi:hypothetical protein
MTFGFAALGGPCQVSPRRMRRTLLISVLYSAATIRVGRVSSLIAAICSGVSLARALDSPTAATGATTSTGLLSRVLNNAAISVTANARSFPVVCMTGFQSSAVIRNGISVASISLSRAARSNAGHKARKLRRWSSQRSVQRANAQ